MGLTLREDIRRVDWIGQLSRGVNILEAKKISEFVSAYVMITIQFTSLGLCLGPGISEFE